MNPVNRSNYKIILPIVILGGLLGFILNKVFRSFGSIKQLSNIFIDLLLVIFAVLILILAYKVKSYVNGKNPKLSGINAAKIFVFSKTGTLVASLIMGFYVGSLLAIIDLFQYSFGFNYAINCIFTIACSAILMVAGIIGEWMCQIPPNKTNEKEKGAVE